MYRVAVLDKAHHVVFLGLFQQRFGRFVVERQRLFAVRLDAGDLLVLEIQRGCIRGCRFCQAGMIYRPNREKNVERLKDLARTMIASTGYEEISLSSLSSSD